MTGDRIVDSHHHFFDPDNADYPWMEADEFAPIRRNWGPDDFLAETAGSGVARSILVQTWSSLSETEYFLALAAQHDFIAGVVGWVDLTDDPRRDIAELVDRPDGAYLKGIRHQVHDESDPNWLLRDDVKGGLRAVRDEELVYDLLVRPRELPAALETVRNFPETRFVIDHIGKPDIREGQRAEWLELVAPFGDLHNVACKVSGLVTEADWHDWDVEELHGYIDAVLGIFGADRVMYGSDWPVCRVAATYSEVLEVVDTYLEPLDTQTRASVLWLTADHWYRLDE